MAAKRDDVQVSGADGFCFPEIMDDETTPIGVLVELRGAAATIATHECIIKNGDTSVTLTTASATAGEVTASVTAANLVTLGVSRGGGFTAFFEGTITDGSVTHRWRYEMPIAVEDRLFRWPVLLSELAVQLPEIAKSCTYPNSQTSWHPQCKLALRRLRNEIDGEQGGLKTHLLAHPDDVKELGEWACLALIAYVMAGTQKGQAASLGEQAATYQKSFDRKWVKTLARVKAGTDAWQTQSAKTVLHLQPVNMMSGLGGNGPGGLL